MLYILILIIIFIIGLYAFLAYKRNDNHKEENNIKEEIPDKIKDEVKQLEKEEEKEEEEIFFFNTDYIKYRVFDEYNLSYASTTIHRDFALENLWIQEPYYSNFFRLLSFIDKDVL